MEANPSYITPIGDNASHTPEYSYSKTWHYKNIDANETFENAQMHESGDVVRAIREQAYILNNPDSSDEQKSLALKMLVHLVGDIHQPMHMGLRSDLGGNRWMVKYFNSPKNLHSIWDSSLPESAHKWSYTEWQQQIDRGYTRRRSRNNCRRFSRKNGEKNVIRLLRKYTIQLPRIQNSAMTISQNGLQS